MHVEIQCIVIEVTDEYVRLRMDHGSNEVDIPRIRDLQGVPINEAPAVGTPIILRGSEGTLGYGLNWKKAVRG